MDPIEIKPNNYITPILLLVSIAFLLMFSTTFVNHDYDYEEYKVIEELHTDYKTKVINNKGTIQLVKGEGKVIHHNIKQDSIILLSRKSIEGTPGTYLIVDNIESNEYFTVKSVDQNNNTVITDLGVVYYTIV